MIELNDIHKKLSLIQKESRQRAKTGKCLICGKSIDGCCNSHHIPAFILRNIAQNGYLLTPSALSGASFPTQKGINQSNTFQIICNDCDSTYFQNYEDESKLTGNISTRMLAEISIKNYLVRLFKRYDEVQLFNLFQTVREKPVIINKELLDEEKQLDIRDYLFYFNRAKKIIDDNFEEQFIIVYNNILPYVVPIAAHSAMGIHYDVNNNLINDKNNYSKDIMMEDLHIIIFPLKEQSLILIFHHKDDHAYDKFDKCFMRRNPAEQLDLISYYLIKYSEEFVMSPNISKEILTNRKLQYLSREVNDIPDFGFISFPELFIKYDTVKWREVPNILNEKFKLK